MELLEQKDLELQERNATIKSYLDKIVCQIILSPNFIKSPFYSIDDL